MKKIISIFLGIILSATCFSGCSPADKTASGGKDGLKITATIFPEYDWVMNVLGENSANNEVTMLLDNGVDLHSYQPTTEDILNISDSDLFIYVGGESDEWVDDALKEAVNKDMTVINLMELLKGSVKEEEFTEGMQKEEGEEAEEETEYDEHVWLSLNNAALAVQRISDALSALDPDNAESYKVNAEAYIGKLKDLDSGYRAAVSDGKYDTLLFGDRFPFRYLVDDYSLLYFAAFAGCSAETEASFETVTFLSSKADELRLPAVITIDGSDKRIAETIVENTASKDQKILTLDSMQSTTSKDIAGGASYLSVMEKNLSVLKEALN